MVWLRLLGVQLYPIHDNILIVGHSSLKVVQSDTKAVLVLTQARFILNLMKSVMTPAQDLKYIETDSGQTWARLSYQREGWMCS